MERIVTRHAIRLAHLQPRSLARILHKPLRQQHLRHRSDDSKKRDDQVYPLTGYYADILSSRHPPTDATPIKQPQPQTSASSTPTSSPSSPPSDAPSPPTPTTTPATSSLEATKAQTLAKARIVFGSSGSSRREDLSSASKTIAGVKVPPKPKEPSGDDCCMSGCVNCVWDIYREEFEEWKLASESAKEALKASQTVAQGQNAAQGDAAVVQGVGSGVGEAMSMDDDGGGSEALWLGEDVKGAEEEKDPFADVPVGIREFMRTEKMLKQRQAAKQAGG